MPKVGCFLINFGLGVLSFSLLLFKRALHLQYHTQRVYMHSERERELVDLPAGGSSCCSRQRRQWVDPVAAAEVVETDERTDRQPSERKGIGKKRNRGRKCVWLVVVVVVVELDRPEGHALPLSLTRAQTRAHTHHEQDWLCRGDSYSQSHFFFIGSIHPRLGSTFYQRILT